MKNIDGTPPHGKGKNVATKPKIDGTPEDQTVLDRKVARLSGVEARTPKSSSFNVAQR